MFTYTQVTGQDDFYQLAGHDNFYPRNFDRLQGQGVKIVLVKTDCPKCVPVTKQEETETFLFDSNGFNIEQYNVFKGKKSGMQKLFLES